MKVLSCQEIQCVYGGYKPEEDIFVTGFGAFLGYVEAVNYYSGITGFFNYAFSTVDPTLVIVTSTLIGALAGHIIYLILDSELSKPSQPT